MTIVELMLKAKEGDNEAYGEIYENYLTPIFRFIFFRVKNREIAEDLTQTVFLKVLEAQGKTPVEKLAKAYFYRTARNLVIDYWRKKKDLLYEPSDLNFIFDEDQSLMEDMDDQIAVTAIKNVINQLDDKDQEIIILKFVNELSNKEISDLMGKSEMAVRQMQCRALKKMREILESYDRKS